LGTLLGLFHWLVVEGKNDFIIDFKRYLGWQNMQRLRVLYTFAGCLKVAICSVSKGGPSPLKTLYNVHSFWSLHLSFNFCRPDSL
jgi:hypothetical protein